MVFSLLFTPIGRYLAVGVTIIVILIGVYWKIKSDAIAEVEAAATTDAIRRMENAVRAGDNAGIGPDRLLQNDGHRRD